MESLALLDPSQPEEALLAADREEMRIAVERPHSVPELVRLLPKALRVTRAFNWRGRPQGIYAWEFNVLLRQLAAGGGSREAADVLLSLLEGGQLEGLSAFRGPTCRSVAVETLLLLGFPYALEVRPEDLEHLRKQRRRQRLRRKLWRHVPGPLAATLLGAGLIGQWLTLSPEWMTSAAGWGTVAAMGLRLLGLIAGTLSAERSIGRVSGLLVLFLSSLLTLMTLPAGLDEFGGVIGPGTGLLASVVLGVTEIRKMPVK